MKTEEEAMTILDKRHAWQAPCHVRDCVFKYRKEVRLNAKTIHKNVKEQHSKNMQPLDLIPLLYRILHFWQRLSEGFFRISTE